MILKLSLLFVIGSSASKPVQAEEPDGAHQELSRLLKNCHISLEELQKARLRIFEASRLVNDEIAAQLPRVPGYRIQNNIGSVEEAQAYLAGREFSPEKLRFLGEGLFAYVFFDRESGQILKVFKNLALKKGRCGEPSAMEQEQHTLDRLKEWIPGEYQRLSFEVARVESQADRLLRRSFHPGVNLEDYLKDESIPAATRQDVLAVFLMRRKIFTEALHQAARKSNISLIENSMEGQDFFYPGLFPQTMTPVVLTLENDLRFLLAFHPQNIVLNPSTLEMSVIDPF